MTDPPRGPGAGRGVALGANATGGGVARGEGCDDADRGGGGLVRLVNGVDGVGTVDEEGIGRELGEEDTSVEERLGDEYRTLRGHVAVGGEPLHGIPPREAVHPHLLRPRVLAV